MERTPRATLIMSHRLHITCIIVFLTIMIMEQAQAQFRTTISLYNSFDDNAFRGASAYPDFITSMGLGFEYQPEESSYYFTYNGNINLFKKYSDRRYFSNAITASYLKPFGDDEKNAWSATGGFMMRFNKEQFNYYDFSQFTGSLNLKYYLSDDNGFLSRAGYRLRYRNYNTLSEFSYLENYGFTSLTKFFETKTTAIIELAFGNKRYASTSMATTGSGGSQGMMGGSGSRMQEDGGMMESQLGSYGNMNPNTRFVMYSSPYTSQMIGTVRLAQSLTPTTGMSIQFAGRWNISERTRYLSNGGVDFRGDEELWDDPYGYQSNEYNITLTQVLPWQISARVTGDYLNKNYGRNIFLETDTDIPTGPKRSDTKFVAGLDMKKSFDDGFMFFQNITLNISYNFIKNNSNDPYYHYQNNAITLGLSTQF